jgi:hypothetical protein
MLRSYGMRVGIKTVGIVFFPEDTDSFTLNEVMNKLDPYIIPVEEAGIDNASYSKELNTPLRNGYYRILAKSTGDEMRIYDVLSSYITDMSLEPGSIDYDLKEEDPKFKRVTVHLGGASEISMSYESLPNEVKSVLNKLVESQNKFWG